MGQFWVQYEKGALSWELGLGLCRFRPWTQRLPAQAGPARDAYACCVHHRVLPGGKTGCRTTLSLMHITFLSHNLKIILVRV